MTTTRAVARPKIARRAVHGVLLLDKDAGVSSNAALQRAKRLYRAEKAGHTGTLDPLASGLLPLCFGAATKFAQASLDADKRYLATLRLGVTTTTGDLEGEVVRSVAGVAVDRAALERGCETFVGAIEQVPPMHSALKHKGKPLYEYARDGVAVERAARRVLIHSIRVVEGSGDLWTIDVSCSKGTYVRTLAEDIGEALGCGAHLAALRRTRQRTAARRSCAADRVPCRVRRGRARRCLCCRPTRSSPIGRETSPVGRGRRTVPRRHAPSPAAAPTHPGFACTAPMAPSSAPATSPAAS